MFLLLRSDEDLLQDADTLVVYGYGCMCWRVRVRAQKGTDRRFSSNADSRTRAEERILVAQLRGYFTLIHNRGRGNRIVAFFPRLAIRQPSDRLFTLLLKTLAVIHPRLSACVIMAILGPSRGLHLGTVMSEKSRYETSPLFFGILLLVGFNRCSFCLHHIWTLLHRLILKGTSFLLEWRIHSDEGIDPCKELVETAEFPFFTLAPCVHSS